MLKKITSLILAIIMALTLATTALALNAGEVYYEDNMKIAPNLTYERKTMWHEIMNRQEAFSLTYTPGGGVSPVVAYGSKLYGTSTISRVAKGLEDSGLNVVGAINGDFFSMATGVPMGIVITDGVLRSSCDGRNGVFFNKDGTAFIGSPKIELTLSVGEETVKINHLNKYRSQYGLYLLNNDFSAGTNVKTKGAEVMFKMVDPNQKLTPNGEVQLTVVDMFESASNMMIPEGHYMLTCDALGPITELQKFKIGDVVTLKATAEDTRLNNVMYAVGGGDTLVENGAMKTEFETSIAGANPRTAVGIKADGSVVLYEIDGRKPTYSNGLTLADLAEEMVRLGCVSALNLDGGGSSAMLVQMGGEEGLTLVNTPTDGRERGCANYILLVSNGKKTGTLANLHSYPNSVTMLKNANTTLSFKGSDGGFNPVALAKLPTLTADGEFLLVEGQKITSKDKVGKDKVTANLNGIITTINVEVLDKVDAIVVRNKGDKAEIKEIKLLPKETLSLDPSATYKARDVIAAPQSFKYTLEGDVGTVDANGVFTPKGDGETKGTLIVSYADKERRIPITIVKDEILSLSNYNNGVITATIRQKGGAIIKDEDVTFKLNGRKIEFTKNNDIYTASVDPRGSGLNRVTVEVRNYNGSIKRVSKDITIAKKESSFTDMKAHWSRDFVEFLSDQKVVTGATSKNGLVYNPENNITRAEFCAIVTRYLGVNVEEYSSVELPFVDKGKNPEWAQNYIKAMYKLGYINGRDSAKGPIFDPLAPITRAESASILGKLLDSRYAEGVTLAFNDKDNIQPWADAGVKALVGLRIVSGYDDGQFKADKFVTRAEIAKMIYHMY